MKLVIYDTYDYIIKVVAKSEYSDAEIADVQFNFSMVDYKPVVVDMSAESAAKIMVDPLLEDMRDFIVMFGKGNLNMNDFSRYLYRMQKQINERS